MGAVKHYFTVEEYRKMGEAGIFQEDVRVELVDGEVVETRPLEIGTSRGHTPDPSALVLDSPGGATLFVSPQNPLTLGEHFEPEPDLVLMRRYKGCSGVPEEVLLAVEVDGTSLSYDRNTKLPLYAAAGIPEAWLLDPNADAIEVYSEPGPGATGRFPA